MTPFEAAKLGLLKQLAKWPAQSFVALRRGVERSLPVAAINEIDGALEQIRKEKLAYVLILWIGNGVLLTRVEVL